MILQPHLLALPPPSELRSLDAMRLRYAIAIPTNDERYLWLLDYPIDTVRNWIAWRSTIYRSRYYGGYTLEIALIRSQDYPSDNVSVSFIYTDRRLTQTTKQTELKYSPVNHYPDEEERTELTMSKTMQTPSPKTKKTPAPKTPTPKAVEVVEEVVTTEDATTAPKVSKKKTDEEKQAEDAAIGLTGKAKVSPASKKAITQGII